jgi:hypothetical protein
MRWLLLPQGTALSWQVIGHILGVICLCRLCHSFLGWVACAQVSCQSFLTKADSIYRLYHHHPFLALDYSAHGLHSSLVLLNIHCMEGSTWNRKQNTKEWDPCYKSCPLSIRQLFVLRCHVTSFVSLRRKPLYTVNPDCIDVSSFEQNLSFLLSTTQLKNWEAEMKGRK